jgi:hypothetical protein
MYMANPMHISIPFTDCTVVKSCKQAELGKHRTLLPLSPTAFVMLAWYIGDSDSVPLLTGHSTGLKYCV